MKSTPVGKLPLPAAGAHVRAICVVVAVACGGPRTPSPSPPVPTARASVAADPPDATAEADLCRRFAGARVQLAAALMDPARTRSEKDALERAYEAEYRPVLLGEIPCSPLWPVPAAPTSSTRGGQQRQGGVEVRGALGKEAVQQVVHAAFGTMRTCFEEGLTHGSNLDGRVVVKFVIDVRGGVSSAVDGGSDLVDRIVVGCILERFRKLIFPAPEHGEATVLYPLRFSPGD